jgi:hypothetical protein
LAPVLERFTLEVLVRHEAPHVLFAEIGNSALKAYARFHALTGDKTNDLSLPVLRELDTAEALRHLGLQRLLLVGVSAVVTGSLNPLGRGVVVLFAVLFSAVW